MIQLLKISINTKKLHLRFEVTKLKNDLEFLYDKHRFKMIKISTLCMPELQKNTSKKLEKVTKIYLFI